MGNNMLHVQLPFHSPSCMRNVASHSGCQAWQLMPAACWYLGAVLLNWAHDTGPHHVAAGSSVGCIVNQFCPPHLPLHRCWRARRPGEAQTCSNSMSFSASECIDSPGADHTSSTIDPDTACVGWEELDCSPTISLRYIYQLYPGGTDKMFGSKMCSFTRIRQRRLPASQVLPPHGAS